MVSFFRSYYRVPCGDELYYQYVWEEDDPTTLWEDHRFERKVETIGDVIQTQKIHYLKVNGRSLVHTIEQVFTGHETLFSVINACVFLIFIALIIYYSGDVASNFFIWIITICTVLWMFPYRESLWVSINYAPNYLWSATLGLSVLSIFKRYKENKHFNKFIAVIIGLLFGWTHEGFVIAIAGGLFIYYCFHFNKWKGNIRWLTIPMWITSAFMLFSPGNIRRYFMAPVSESDRLFNSITKAIDNISHLWLINALVIVFIILLIVGKRDYLSSMVRQHSILFIMLITGFLFSLFANTYPYSFTAVELLSLLIFIQLLKSIKIEPAISITISGLMFCALIVWGILTVRDTRGNYYAQKQMLSEYLSSPSGLVLAIPSPTSWLTRPFMRTWDISQSETYSYIKSIEKVYHRNQKLFTLLNESDYRSLNDTSFIFQKQHRIWNNLPFFMVPNGKKVWINESEISDSVPLRAPFKPVNFFDKDVPLLIRLKFLATPSSYPSSGKVSIENVPLPNSTDSIICVFEKDLGLRQLDLNQ